MTAHGLYEPDGEDWLRLQYVENKLSTYEIAELIGSYANKVRRALRHYRIPLRKRGAAMKLVIKKGRHCVKTERKKRDFVTRGKIGRKLALSWQNITPEERERRVEQAKERWNNRPHEEKIRLFRMAREGAQSALRYGSRLERFIANALLEYGENVNLRSYVWGVKVDVDLPHYNAVIFVDGPSYHSPIFGWEKLAVQQDKRAKASAHLIEHGVHVIIVKDTKKEISDYLMRETFEKVRGTLNKLGPVIKIHQVEV